MDARVALGALLFLLSVTTPHLRAEVERQVLFRAGDGAYASYRIPAIVTTTKGTVLAFCEGRKGSASDTGEINLLMRRSPDGGKTFEPAVAVWQDGPNTCGNPCPVVDEDTGVVWLLMTHNLGEDRERDIIAGTAKGTRTVWITSTADDGVTWDRPRDITKDVKRDGWRWYATGPGIGIQLKQGGKRGRLVVPCDYIASDGGNSHVIYSDDHGKTWNLGGEPAERCFNESQVVELNDGRVMLNMRNARVGKGQEQPLKRGVAVSEDGGETFSTWWRHEALVEPVCQASILRYDPTTILFANPASEKRERMTVRLSEDEGKTWHKSRVLWDGPAAYSCLVKLPGGHVGLLYEGGDGKAYERIELARFEMGWLKGQ